MTLNINTKASASLTASDTYTTGALYHGEFPMRIRGTWSGTITLQRSDDNEATYDDVEDFTSNVLRVVIEPAIPGAYWRIGFKAAAYSSGTAQVQLG